MNAAQTTASAVKTFAARYAGTCALTGVRFAVGTRVRRVAAGYALADAVESPRAAEYQIVVQAENEAAELLRAYRAAGHSETALAACHRVFDVMSPAAKRAFERLQADTYDR